MGRPGGPLAGKLADLATVTLDLLNMVEGNPEAEPDTNGEPCLGWSATGATGTLNVSAFLLDPEEEHDGREPDADDGDPSYVPPRLDVFPQALPTFPAFVLTAALEGLAHELTPATAASSSPAPPPRPWRAPWRPFPPSRPYVCARRGFLVRRGEGDLAPELAPD